MIDPEGEVFNNVRTALVRAWPGVLVTSADVIDAAQLPALQLQMIDCAVDTARSESGNPEYSAICEFEAQSFSGSSYTEARTLLADADAEMARMGFRRTFYGRIANADPSIRRCAARWTGTVFEDGRVGI